MVRSASRAPTAPRSWRFPSSSFSHGETRNLLMRRAPGRACGVPHPGCGAGGSGLVGAVARRLRARPRRRARLRSVPAAGRRFADGRTRADRMVSLVRARRCSADRSPSPFRTDDSGDRARGHTRLLHRRQRLPRASGVGGRAVSRRSRTPRTERSPWTCCERATRRSTCRRLA